MKKIYGYETPTQVAKMAIKRLVMAILCLPLGVFMAACATINVTEVDQPDDLMPVTVAETEADARILEVMGYE